MGLAPSVLRPQSRDVSIRAAGNCSLKIASLILASWAVSLTFALSLEVRSLHPVWLLPLLLWQMFLYTGLFITAHDAMHGSVAPDSPQINHQVGRIALFLYGLLPYQTLLVAHEHHHQYPASDRDPDFHDGQHQHVLFWYIRFMRRYNSIRQWLGIAGIYHGLHLMAHVDEVNLILFWAVPAFLSSIQLFYFGTFLAHRQKTDEVSHSSRANSIYRPFWWSLVTCYHFGYHREHHQYPHLPWWQLPSGVAPLDV